MHFKVLQRPKDMDLDLYSSVPKEKHKMMARVTLQSITSKPVTYDDGKTMSLSGVGKPWEFYCIHCKRENKNLAQCINSVALGLRQSYNLHLRFSPIF